MKNLRISKGALVLFLCVIVLFCTVNMFSHKASAATISEASLAETHVLLDWQPTACAFWESTSRIDLAISPNDDFYKKFVSSAVRFTKDDIPVGSVIYIDSGYQYRPDGWQTATGKNTATRPGNVTTSCIEVDETWWGNFTLRAFNVSRPDGALLNEKVDEVEKALRIYVPRKYPYTEFTWENGFYDSTKGSTIATGTDLAKKFVATQIFSKDQIPVGSVITIDSGYQYRANLWVNTSTNASSRPNNVTTASVTVTDTWWGSYNYVAFNISTTSLADISSNYLEVASHFNITLPDGTKFVHPEAEDPVDPNPVVIPDDDSAVRILSIGNSYSGDATIYAGKIADGLGIKAEFYNLYYGGCTIENHYNFYQSDSAQYDFYKDMTEYVSTKVTLKNVLEAAQFDYITFQQGSWQSDDYANYALLDELMAIAREYQPDAEFLIHQTWGYCEARACSGDADHTTGYKGYATSADMFTKVEECYANAAADNGNLRIIKSGRAIELAKTVFTYTDDYGKENSVYSDFNSHLSGKGDYIAGCVFVETIFGDDEADVRNTSFTAGFDDAYVLREIAHQVVHSTSGAAISFNSNISPTYAPIMKSADKDGFNYDGRTRLTLTNAASGKTVMVVYQNSDGTFPSLEYMPEGTFNLTAEKSGFLPTTLSVSLTRDGNTTLPGFSLVPGDIKENESDFSGDGIIDIDDLLRILRAFTNNCTEYLKTITDLNGNGVADVEDFSHVKAGLISK